MAGLNVMCKMTTTFTKAGDLDEQAFRQFLHRFIDANVGVYIGSGGAGQGHSMNAAELDRIYRIGVEEGKGKISIWAAPPEQHSARAVRDHSLLAQNAGMELVNIYAPAGWHSYRPTDAEILAYYDDVLPAIKMPVALSAQPLVGYMVKPGIIAQVCRKYRQITTINISGVSDAYMLELKELMDRPLDYYVLMPGSLNALAFGVAGMVGPEANLIPKTHRLYIDLFEKGEFAEMSRVYADMMRLNRYTSKWTNITRWMAMAMKAMKLPGGQGAPREPYRMPADDEIERFMDGLLRLRIPEVEEQARAAGLPIPN